MGAAGYAENILADVGTWRVMIDIVGYVNGIHKAHVRMHMVVGKLARPLQLSLLTDSGP